jgi:hypothetical protein
MVAALRSAAPVQPHPTAQHGGANTTATATATPNQATATPSSEVTTTSAVTAVQASASPSSGRVTTGTGTATPYPTKPPEMPQCQSVDFAVQIKPQQSTYSISSGQRAAFDIALIYHGTVECKGYMGSTVPLIRVYNSQGQLVYKDVCGDECPRFPPYNPVTPGETMGTTTDKWDETQCSTDQCASCQFNCPPRSPVGPGGYTVISVDDPYRQSQPAAFQLTP